VRRPPVFVGFGSLAGIQSIQAPPSGKHGQKPAFLRQKDLPRRFDALHIKH
jgi:hypothetical protein